MAVDPKPKGATPPSDKEWISRALAAMPDPAIATRPAPPPPASAPAASSRAANDDRQSIGDLLRGLQLRPASRSYFVASILSAIWLLLGASFAIAYLPAIQTALMQTGVAVPVLIGLGALVLLPISFFLMLGHMSWRARELRLITESMASLALRLAEPQAAAQEAMTQVGDSLRREISLMNSSVENALERAAELETRVTGQTAALERANRDAETYARDMSVRLADQHRYVEEQSDLLRGAVEAGREYSEKAHAMMRSFVEDMDKRVDAQVGDLSARLETTLSRFQQAVETRSRAADESLGSRAQDLIRGMSESGKDLAAALDRRVKDAAVVIDSRAAEIEDIIGAKIELLDSTLQHRLVSIAQTLDARVAHLEDIAAGRAHEAASQIEMQARSTAEALDSHLSQLIQTVKINAGEASGMLESRSKAAIDALVGRMQQIAQSIENRTEAARQSIGKLADDVENRISAVSASAGNTMTRDADAVVSKLSGVSENVAGALTQNAQYVERTLLGASADAARTFVSESDRITSAVREHAIEMTALLDSKSSGLLQAVQKRSADFTSEITRATEQALNLLDTQGSAFARAVADNGGRIAGDIAAASSAAAEALNASVRQAEDATKAALERSRQITTTSLGEMREVHGLLRTESMSMFERLREANVLLREALNSSQDSIGTLEKKLAKRLTELVTTMKTVGSRSGAVTEELQGHISSFQESALRVLEDLSQLAMQFESHGHSLVQTVDLIDNINQRTVDTVNSRGAVLDQLITTLDTRASDFEQRLLRFSGLLDDSLDSATTRTRDIGLLIAEASSHGVRAITEQYDVVRGAVEHENQRTADFMKQVYQNTVGETQVNLQQSAERFTELLQSIKRMAGDMQRELEMTREELRRGVLDIPRETAESMTQMRQVIIDQVEALAELHRIVAKHGRSTGVAESRRPLLEDQSAERAERPRREAPPPPMPPAGMRGDGGGKKGWLSDLLQRADAAPSGRSEGGQGIQSLDALSADIARIIDHDAVSELWDRYNRGERNVFTRKLYTREGQRAFDEIRGRYKNDRDFKHTVDRYMAEFERLIEEVSRDDRGQAMVRTYLTSETGKVYTMLAHAAGRLD